MQFLDHQQLVEGSADAIIVCDVIGRIVLWNAACERLFGYSKNEALNQSLDIIIPQRQQTRHWDGYHLTMSSGVTKYGQSVLRVPALHKLGHTMSIAFTVSLLKDLDGQVSAITAIVRDESESFAKDRAQRLRIAELEAALVSPS